jgi:hypothetical protein
LAIRQAPRGGLVAKALLLGPALAVDENPPDEIRRGPCLIEYEMPPDKETETYFNELLIEVNWVLRLLPRPFTTAIIASAIPAAIKPYSIAVAPD